MSVDRIRISRYGWSASMAPPMTRLGFLVLAVSLMGCGDDARISVSADLAPPLSLDMLTVTLRDRDRLLTWHGSDFRPRPENATPSTGEQDIFTSGPDLELTYQLESGGEVLSSGSVTLPRRSDWIWGVTIWARTTDPLEGCFGCFGSAAFSLAQAFRAVERDSVWMVWGGNSISDPVIY
jgi:hypothetical protein